MPVAASLSVPVVSEAHGSTPRAMIRPPAGMGRFEFAVLASLRAAQLTRGCVPRVTGDHSTAVLAQREIAECEVVPTTEWPRQGESVETPAS